VDIHVEGAGTVVVSVAGEVDLATAPQLEQSLGEVLEQSDTREVRVDMSAVEFMDSAGLRVLIAALGRATESNRTLTLQSPSDRVHRLIEIAGLAELFGVAGNGGGDSQRPDRRLEKS
jgi:anti-sigma B factor antagonist